MLWPWIICSALVDTHLSGSLWRGPRVDFNVSEGWQGVASPGHVMLCAITWLLLLPANILSTLALELVLGQSLLKDTFAAENQFPLIARGVTKCRLFPNAMRRAEANSSLAEKKKFWGQWLLKVTLAADTQWFSVFEGLAEARLLPKVMKGAEGNFPWICK